MIAARGGRVLLAALVVLGATAAGVLERDELISIDRPVTSFVFAHREHWLTSTLEIATWAGSAWVLVPVLAVLGLVLRRLTGSWTPLAFLAAALAGASTLSNTFKLVIARPRPDAEALVDALGYSFPSGHATAAMAGWLGAAVVLGAVTTRRARKVALVAAALLIAAVVGVSRVYLGVHEPTDVLAGWALGACWLAVVVGIARVLGRRRVGAGGRARR